MHAGDGYTQRAEVSSAMFPHGNRHEDLLCPPPAAIPRRSRESSAFMKCDHERAASARPYFEVDPLLRQVAFEPAVFPVIVFISALLSRLFPSALLS